MFPGLTAMKSGDYLLLWAFGLLSLNSLGQGSFHTGPAVFSDLNHSIRIDTVILNTDTLYLSDPLLTEFINRMEKARKTNAIGLFFGGLANLSLVINGGFLNPEEDIKEYEPVVAIVGLTSGVSRIVLSFSTLSQVSRARETLLSYTALPGNDSLFQTTLKSLKTARNLSITIPSLGLGALAFMGVGYMAYGHGNDALGNFCFTSGWICAGTGLLCSLIDQGMIVKTQKVFRSESASLGLSSNHNGVGICFRF